MRGKESWERESVEREREREWGENEERGRGIVYICI